MILISNFSVKSVAQNSSVIFFLSPLHDSVDELLQRFRTDIRADAHLLFTSEIPDNLFSRIKSSKLSSNLKTLKELHLCFFPVDSLCFSLETMESVYSIYNPSSPSFLDFELENIAKKVFKQENLRGIDQGCDGNSRRISLY